MRIRILLVSLVAVLVLGACGDDSGSSSGTSDGAGTSAAAGETSGASSSGGDSGGDTTGGAATTAATTTTEPNPVVPDSQTTAGLVQTAVQMKLLAAAVEAGQATPDAFDKVAADWDVYDGTIQRNNPQVWQTLTDALTAMQNAVTNKDAAAAAAAASAFEAASNAYLGSG